MPAVCSEMAGFTSVHSPIILRNTTTAITKQTGPPDIPTIPGNTTTTTTCPITNASNTTTITNTSSYTTTTTTAVLLLYYYR